MDYLEKALRSKKSLERVNAINLAIKTAFFLILALLAGSAVIRAWSSSYFANNSTAINSILTSVLVLVTIYYSWWTREMVKSEQRRFEAQFRPIITLRNFSINIESAEAEDLSCTLSMNLSVFNAPLLRLYVSYDYPLRWDRKKNEFEYCNGNLRVIPLVRPEEVVPISLDRLRPFPRQKDLVTARAYFKISLQYEDNLLNLYKDVYFVRINCQDFTKSKNRLPGMPCYYYSAYDCHLNRSRLPASRRADSRRPL
jgi:hypothetical protein